MTARLRGGLLASTGVLALPAASLSYRSPGSEAAGAR